MAGKSRTTACDVPPVSDGQTVTVTTRDDSFTGTVTRVDTYSETTTVERVINYTITFKHEIAGEQFEPWKAYLIEEPTDEYRLNVCYSDGSVSRTENIDTLTGVSVESEKKTIEA